MRTGRKTKNGTKYSAEYKADVLKLTGEMGAAQHASNWNYPRKPFTTDGGKNG